ncbi:MAG: hypothetical protein WCF04_00785 [Candidatus Nanopelagicales bacterium]
MGLSRIASVLVTAATVAVAVVGCAAEDAGSDQSPTPSETISVDELAIASLLPAQSVPPAPPGDVLVDSMDPFSATGVIGEPSRQVMTCTPLELPPMDDPGPAEPGATAAAWSGFVTGAAQVDQYAIVYTDETTAQEAVTRSRARAEDCEAAFAVHSPGAEAEAVVAGSPSAVDGFRVHATYHYTDTGYTSDEVSAVLRSGRTVLYLRANELGAPDSKDLPSDGILDQAWTDELIEAAAAQLTG